MTPATVRGVHETSLYVGDSEASGRFYTQLLGCREILRQEGRMQALRVPGGQVLLLFDRGQSVEPTETEGGLIPAHDGRGILHLAFELDDAEIPSWRQRLADFGIAIESEVDWPGGGHSIYFRDPDGHSLELVTRACWENRG